MSESTKYTCKKCTAVFQVDRWADCSNCREPVPPEIRALYIKSEEEKVANWQSLLNITKTSSSDSNRKERQARKQSSVAEEQVNQPWDPARLISADARAIVQSQAKTTYAVRSLALYLFITLQSGLFGGGLVFLVINSKSNYDEYGQLNSGSIFLVFLGSLIAFIGFIVAVIVGRNELDKSRL
jgi:hypothetical protein